MSWLWATLVPILVAAVVWLRGRLVLVDVDGWSMAPALADGDRLLVWRTRFRAIRRGQVVVFEQPSPALAWPTTPCRGSVAGYRWLVKRVEALPGDPPPDFFSLRHRTETRVPDGFLLAVGDNRDNSVDSRALGYIPRQRVLGVALCRVGTSARVAARGP